VHACHCLVMSGSWLGLLSCPKSVWAMKIFFVIFAKNSTVGIGGSVYPSWPPTRILLTSDMPYQPNLSVFLVGCKKRQEWLILDARDRFAMHS
jgi:hypothetical protein